MDRTGFSRMVRSLIFPGGVVTAGGTGLILATDFNLWIAPHAATYPPVIYAVGLLLAWRFNKHRHTLAILSIAAMERAVFYLGTHPDSAMNPGSLVTQAAIIVFPVNLMAVSWMTERGFNSWKGYFKIAVLLLEFAGIAWVVRYMPEYIKLVSGWTCPYISLQLPGIPHASMLGFSAAALVLMVKFYRTPTVGEAGLIWLLIAAGMGILLRGPGTSSTAFFALGALVVSLAIFELSYRLAYMDELTDLPARRALNEALVTLGSKYSVAMVDIDHFKKFNDRYGHDVGDQALRLVASVLRRVTGGGKPFRYGGEEFAILFPGRSAADILPHLENLRKAVAAAKFTIRSRRRKRTQPSDKKPVRGKTRRVIITVSIGVAERTDRCPEVHQVVKSADKALYRAKRAGRNRVSD